MSAPSSSRLFIALAVALAALVAAGCTVPGSSRLQGPPEGLPPSLDYVTADVLGFSLFDTDPESKLWAGLGEERAQQSLAALHSPLTGGFDADLADVEPWIGDAAGVALRELDLDGDTETATLYYADVRNRPKLEAFLEDAGWEQASKDDLSGPGEGLELWTNDHVCDDTPGGSSGVCAAPSHLSYRAVAVSSHAVVAARSTKALRSLLTSAEKYAVPDRKAMSEYAVEAAKRVPMAFVFRSDLIRTQVRRPFEGDPALLEFARWATDSNTLVALRDGWLGVAPPIDRTRDAIRIVGASEWVPDLAPDIDLKPVKRDVLDQLSIRPDVAIAIHNPGQQLRELVRAITVGAGQYVTEQDVSKQDRVELLPVLDALDGDAVFGWSRRTSAGEFRVQVKDPDDVSELVENALRHGKVDATTDVEDGFVIVRAPEHSVRVVPEGTSKQSGRPSHAALDLAGTPPRPPVVWIWKAGGPCTGPVVGWVTFDGTDELRTSLDVSLDAAGRCGDGLAVDTLASLGIPPVPTQCVEDRVQRMVMCSP